MYFAIVKSLRHREMTEEANIPNGTGLTAQQVALRDGDEVEVTCEDDRASTWPAFMGIANIVNAQSNGASPSNITLQVLNNDYNAGRKQNGERVILAKKYTLITPS